MRQIFCLLSTTWFSPQTHSQNTLDKALKIILLSHYARYTTRREEFLLPQLDSTTRTLALSSTELFLPATQACDMVFVKVSMSVGTYTGVIFFISTLVILFFMCLEFGGRVLL